MGIPWQWPQSIISFWQESFLLLGEILAEFPWAIDHCLLSLQNSSRNPIQSSVKINAHFKNFPQGPHTQKRTSLWGEWGIWLPNIRISKKKTSVFHTKNVDSSFMKRCDKNSHLNTVLTRSDTFSHKPLVTLGKTVDKIVCPYIM